MTATGQADEERKRSTIGVAETFGGHPLDAASATQSLVALSTAEAFYACNRGTAGGLQTCHFCGATATPAAGPSAGKTLRDPARVDTGTAAERAVVAEVFSHR